MDSDANAPDSWDSLDDPGPGEMSEGTSDLSAQLHSLNVNAKPFVPNVNAPAFVPSFLKTVTTDGKALSSLLILTLSSLWVNTLTTIVSWWSFKSIFPDHSLYRCTRALSRSDWSHFSFHFSDDVIKNSWCYLLKSLFCAFLTVKRPLCKLLNPRQINISACANSQLVLPLILWLLWESCFTFIMDSSYFGLFMIQLLLLQMGMLISRKLPRKIQTLLRVSIVEYLMNWSDVFTTVWS